MKAVVICKYSYAVEEDAVKAVAVYILSCLVVIIFSHEPLAIVNMFS